MKIKGFITAASALMLFSSLASAGDPVQMWKCNVNGDVAEEDVMAQAAAWKKAAGELAGGERTDLQLIADRTANAVGKRLEHTVEIVVGSSVLV